MADDIDIEEHDILQNPLIKDIKAEPTERAGGNEDDDDESMDTLLYSDDVPKSDSECDAERDVNGGKKNSHEKTQDSTVKDGKKTAGTEKGLDTVVILEDWGERLNNSPCYCKQCKTLFATRNALDSHNMTAHSFLMAIDSPGSPDKSQEETKFCDHCKKYFNDTDFIQHLYDLLSARKKQKEGKEEFYSCSICSYLFQNEKNLHEHMLKNHDNTSSIYNKVHFQSKCKICDKNVTTAVLHNEHVKTCHKEHYQKKVQATITKFDLSISKKSDGDDDNTRNKECHYKCSACKTNFKNPNSARVHNKTYHPDERTIVYTGPADRQTYNTRPQYQSSLPKNVIFKCSECPVHFLSCIVAIAHNIQKPCSLLNTWTCPKCKKDFRTVDKEYHELQHEAASKIRSFTFIDNIYARVACKCFECGVFFEERGLLKHRKDGCTGDSASKHCTICNVKFSNMKRHSMKHNNNKFEKKDFIFINEFLSPMQNEKADKRKLQEHANTPLAKKKKNLSDISDKISLYYCEVCDMVIKPSASFNKTLEKLHLGGCKNEGGLHCGKCGLLVPSREALESHKVDHTDRNLELKDIIFFSMFHLQLTVPRVPRFPKCSFGVQHLSAKPSGHQCDDPVLNCDLCQQRFDDFTYELHLKHHDHFDHPLPDSEISEYIQTCQSVKKTGNILYTCKSCDLSSDSYDYVVEHCQHHLNKIERDIAIQECPTCSLKFDVFSLQKHQDLHLVRKINKNSFKILRYDYSTLPSDDWFEIFSTLSEAEVRQIMCQSLYVSRLVKMALILDGPPELTLYKCEACKCYVQRDGVSTHVQRCSGPCTTFRCSSCSIPFSSAAGLERHRTLHDGKDISTNSYRIISFNNKEDKDFNNKLQVHARASEKKVRGNDELEANRSKIINCGETEQDSGNDTTEDSEEDADGMEEGSHDEKIHHSSGRPRRETRKSIKASEASEQGSQDTDDESDDFSSSDDFEQPSTSKAKQSKEFSQCGDEFRVFECSCGLHFNTTKTLETHLKVCSKEDEESKECRKCGLLFSTNLLQKHICRNCSHGKSLDRNIPTIPLHNCAECECMFLSRKSISEHNISGTCNSEFGSRCPYCGLRFHKKGLKLHRKRHKKYDSMGLKYKIITLKNTKPNIYKCVPCDLHFIDTETFHRHTLDDKTESSKCNLCGLKFLNYALEAHQFRHHKIGQKYEIDDFNINILSKSHTQVLDEGKATKSKGKPENVKKMSFTYKSVNYDNQLYKCACGVCFTNFHTFNRHRHTKCKKGKTEKSRKCPMCGYLFCESLVVKHMLVHHQLMNLSKNDFVIRGYHLKPLSRKCKKLVQKGKSKALEMNTLYKCETCNMHFIAEKSILKHLYAKHKVSYERQGCLKCGLRFSPKSLKKHMIIHHEKRKYRLNDFHIYSVDLIKKAVDKYDAKSLTTETETDEDEKQFKKVCKNKTSSRNSENKTPLPENCNALVQNADKDIPQSVNETENTKAKFFNRVVYRCSVCDLHFVTLHAITWHLENNHPAKMEIVNCDCGLRFTKLSLKTHQIMHHGRAGFSVDDLIIKDMEKSARLQDFNYKMLYKCVICGLHYMSPLTLLDHIQKGIHRMTGRVNCPDCGLVFTKLSLCKHRVLQHEQNSMKLEDFIINTTLFVDKNTTVENKTSPDKNNLLDQSVSEKTDLNNLATDSDTSKEINSGVLRANEVNPENRSEIENRSDAGNRTDAENKLGDDNELDPVIDSVQTDSDDITTEKRDTEKSNDNKNENHKECSNHELSISEKISVENKEAEDVDAETLPEKESSELTVENEKECSTSPSSKDLNKSVGELSNENVDKKSPVKLFKCGECNVHFLKQNSCLKHVQNHKPMDPREYIECKLCNLQFKIESFAKHIRIHHTDDFDLAKVLVEEYQRKEGQTPSIELYYVKDKVDSVLVSTTTDDDKVSENIEKSESQISGSTSVETAGVSNIKQNTETINLDSDEDTQLDNEHISEIKNEICNDWGEETGVDELDANVTDDGKSRNGERGTFKMLEIKQESPEKIYTCKFCTESFGSNRAKEFHESLDHLDAAKDCPICKTNFNASILNELHLNIKNDVFVCCLCDCKLPVYKLYEHSDSHQTQNN